MADAFLQFLLERLNSLIQKELGLIWGVDKEMKKLSSLLATIQAVLEDAEEKQIKDRALQNWLRKLKDAAYKVDDILDECSIEVARLESNGQKRFSREDGRELLQCLTYLNISKCPKLTLPRLPSVTKLTVSDCNEVLLGSISNLKSLTFLEVLDNNKLTDLPQCMPLNLTSLNQLYISSFSKMKCFPTELVGLCALETLDISWCDEFESFPEQGMEGLKSLINLRLDNCRKFTTLSEGLQHLSCLEKLTLTCCPELVALPDGIKYLNSLQHLQISGTDRIDVQSSSIIGSPKLAKLAVLPEALRYVPALQSLCISCYPNLASLPHWLGDLTSLQTLIVYDCPKLSSLPASIQGLTNLQKLAFWKCPELVKRCEKETGEDWYKIAHIPNVYANYY